MTASKDSARRGRRLTLALRTRFQDRRRLAPGRRELDVRQAELALEVDDLARVGSFKGVTGELENVAPQEKATEKSKIGTDSKPDVDRAEQDAQDRGRNAQDVQEKLIRFWCRSSQCPTRRLGGWGG